jgi:hypothetical protein
LEDIAQLRLVESGGKIGVAFQVSHVSNLVSARSAILEPQNCSAQGTRVRAPQFDEEHGPPRPRPAMPERDYHLAQADWHIAETKQLMARQRDFVAMLETTNQPSEPALLMLEALERT